VAALVTGIGAVCLFVSCLSTGENVLRISMPQLWGLIFAGLFTVGLVMFLWLKSIGDAPVTLAAPFWYLAPVLGVAWALVSGWHVSLWWTLSGVALVLLSLRTVLSGRQQNPLTLADVIRSSSE
jgi:drug/metabolite transporter (DMT)-like permease